MFDFLGWFGGEILWGPWTFFVLLFMGILFTVWTKFTQYRSLTHGIAVVRGVYDDPNDPGAINHFQALSAALSATVGLGNIGGVALAIGAGGPGALFWMWVVGFLGMALKTVEITLAMQYRNVDDPDNPHGGAMWVVDKVIGGRGGIWKSIAKAIGVFFCITLIISTFTGGNMFQSWSVANLTEGYFGIPKIATGIMMAVIVGAVIIGGIKRIGNVAGTLVPVMCVIYLLCGLAVIAMHIVDIPGLLILIVKSAFSPTEVGGAFVGGSLGYIFQQGLKRALFSNEAGQGSAPIAHAAAKTDEPAREGIVGGIGPFIDTICICTLTALVILSTGTWNRGALLQYEVSPVVTPAFAFSESQFTSADNVAIGTKVFMLLGGEVLSEDTNGPQPSDRISGVIAKNDEGQQVVSWGEYSAATPPESATLEIQTEGTGGGPDPVIATIAAMPASSRAVDDKKTEDTSDDVPKWGLLSASQSVSVPQEKEYLWANLGDVFTVIHGDVNADSDLTLHKLGGKATRSDQGVVTIAWETIAANEMPTLEEGTGAFRNYDGANLTGHAFDRQFPGLGKWLVTFAAWLFAISTMISWSYYGEQGMVYMLGNKSVLPYKFVFLLGCIWAAFGIEDTAQMLILMDLGTGAMLWANLPIVLCLGYLAVGSLTKYDRQLKAGEFTRHDKPSVDDLMSGRDVE